MNENNIISFFKANNGKTYTNDKGKKIKLDLTSLDVFKEKMSTKEKRRKMFDTVWGAGINLFGKYNDFEKKYGGTASAAVGNGENIKKLISIDGDVEETTSPNQGVKVVKTKGGDRIRIFFNNGRYVSRKNLNNINDKTDEITGIWYFVGGDNYQIKYYNDNKTEVYDFKAKNIIKVSDKPFTPPSPKTQGSSSKPILEKLMKIDSTIKKTTSPDQVIYRSNVGGIHIFYSDGNFRYRTSSVNNKKDELTGRWKFLGNDSYQINTNDDDVYIYGKGWESNKISSSSGTMGKTWDEVTFTLEDVLAGKAVLKRGMKGKAVEDLQKLMIDMNLSKVSKSGKPDGKYGKLTELSIRQFQGEMRHGEQDGKVGERTLKRMYYVYNYDPDKEVDDEQPQMPLDGQNVEPQTSQPQIPAGGENTTTAAPVAAPDTTQAPTATQPKKKLRLSPINE